MQHFTVMLFYQLTWIKDTKNTIFPRVLNKKFVTRENLQNPEYRFD